MHLLHEAVGCNFGRHRDTDAASPSMISKRRSLQLKEYFVYNFGSFSGGLPVFNEPAIYTNFIQRSASNVLIVLSMSDQYSFHS